MKKFEIGTILKMASYEGQDNMRISKNDETTQDLLKNNLGVEISPQFLDFLGTTQ